MSAGSGSLARHAQDPPELGKTVVVNIAPSPNPSVSGPILPEIGDESSKSDSSLGIVVYSDVHAPVNTDTGMGMGVDDEEFSSLPPVVVNAVQ